MNRFSLVGATYSKEALTRAILPDLALLPIHSSGHVTSLFGVLVE